MPRVAALLNALRNLSTLAARAAPPTPPPRPRLPSPATFRTMASLQRAVVRSSPEDPNLTIVLVVGGKQRNMERPKEELLEKPLARLQRSAAPRADKKARRGEARPLEPSTPAAAAAADVGVPFVGLHFGPSVDSPLLDPGAVTNQEAWQDGRLLRLGGACYRVQVNPPTADGVAVFGSVFAGVPVMVNAAVR
jgi:hypothetical protein